MKMISQIFLLILINMEKLSFFHVYFFDLFNNFHDVCGTHLFVGEQSDIYS